MRLEYATLAAYADQMIRRSAICSVFWINGKKYHFITGKKETWVDERLTKQIEQRVSDDQTK